MAHITMRASGKETPVHSGFQEKFLSLHSSKMRVEPSTKKEKNKKKKRNLMNHGYIIQYLSLDARNERRVADPTVKGDVPSGSHDDLAGTGAGLAGV
jgi:hypothetical protein